MRLKHTSFVSQGEPFVRTWALVRCQSASDSQIWKAFLLPWKELARTRTAGYVLFLSEMTSAVEEAIDPTSLEWTERELRRQVRSLMVEVEARENAEDQERKDKVALEAAQAASRPQAPIARRSKSARARRGSSSRAKSGSARAAKVKSGIAPAAKAKSGSGTRSRASRRSSGSLRTRVSPRGSGSAATTLWVVLGALAVGFLGLAVVAL